MTALELQANKQSLIESILSIDDADTIEKVKKYVSRLRKADTTKTTSEVGIAYLLYKAVKASLNEIYPVYGMLPNHSSAYLCCINKT